MPKFWLFKSEPDVYGIQHLAAEKGQQVRWDGIRNFQARNFIRDDIAVGDQVLFYHSSCKDVGVAGICQVISGAYPDPTQFDGNSPYFDAKATLEKPKWFSVDIRLEEIFLQVVKASQLRARGQLGGMVLFKSPRLSVQPVTEEEWSNILTVADGRNQRRHSEGR